jgi:hypothetical protein
MISLRTLAVVLAGSVLATVAGCAGESAEPAAADSDFTGGKAKPGFKELSREWGGAKAVDLAVRDSTAYVGLGISGLAVMDLATLKTTRTVTRDAHDKLLVADTVQVVDDELMVAGLRNDAPLDPYRGGAQDNFAITFLDRATGAVNKQLLVDVMSTVTTPGDSLFDLPRMAATVDGGRIHIMVAHAKAKKVLSIPIPSARETKLVLSDLLGAGAFAIGDAGKDIAVHGGAAYVPEPDGRSNGFVQRVDLATGATTKVGAGLGYPVGVSFGGRAMFVANHESALFVLDADSGATLRQIAVPDWVTAVTSDKDNVYVATWTGIFIAKNEWP